MGKIPVLLAVLLSILTVTAALPVNAVEPPAASGKLADGLVENSWAGKAGMPQGGAVYGAATVNGKIYAFGAYKYNSTVYATTGEYNPATDTWIIKAEMPTKRINFATAVYENKIYIIGGQELQNWPALNTVEVYDPAANKWTNVAPMPAPRAFIQANVVDGKIYVIGGSAVSKPNPASGMTNTTQVYDPLSNSWSTGTSCSNPIYSYSSVVLYKKIYVFGGVEKFLTLSSIGIYNVDVHPTNKTQIYDPATGNWTTGASLPKAVGGAVAGATSGATAPKGIYVFGGYNEYGSATRLTQIYDPTTNNWINGTQTPEYQYNSAIANLDDTFYLVGGMYSMYIPSLSGFPEENPPPPFPTSNYQYIPFGYGTFNPLPTPPATPSPLGLGSPFSVVAVVFGVVVVCVLIAGLLVYFKKRKR